MLHFYPICSGIFMLYMGGLETSGVGLGLRWGSWGGLGVKWYPYYYILHSIINNHSKILLTLLL